MDEQLNSPQGAENNTPVQVPVPPSRTPKKFGKVFWVLLLILIVVGAAIGFWVVQKKQTTIKNNPAQKISSKEVINFVPANQNTLPSHIPSGLLNLTSGNEVVIKYSSNLADKPSAQKSYIQLIVNGTVSENLKLYSDYLISEGWQVSLEKSFGSGLSGHKAGDTISILLMANPKNPADTLVNVNVFF